MATFTFAFISEIVCVVHNADDKDILLRGTTGDDQLYGTPGSDIVVGLAGNDTFVGSPGDDFFYGNDRDAQGWASPKPPIRRPITASGTTANSAAGA